MQLTEICPILSTTWKQNCIGAYQRMGIMLKEIWKYCSYWMGRPNCNNIIIITSLLHSVGHLSPNSWSRKLNFKLKFLKTGNYCSNLSLKFKLFITKKYWINLTFLLLTVVSVLYFNELFIHVWVWQHHHKQLKCHKWF